MDKSQREKIEILCIFVVLLAAIISSGGMSRFTAFAQVVSKLSLGGGEQVEVSCRDGNIPLLTMSGALALLGCPNPSITVTPTPTPVVAQNVVANSDFSSAVDWTLSGAAINSGKVVLNGGSAYLSQKIDLKLKPGATYVVSADVKVLNSGSVSWGGPTLGLARYPDMGDFFFGSARAVVNNNVVQKIVFEKTITDLSIPVYVGVRNFGFSGSAEVDNISVVVKGAVSASITPAPTSRPGVTPTSTPVPTSTPRLSPTSTPMPGMGGGSMTGMSMAMMAWGPGTKNPPGVGDKCSDGTSIVDAHNSFYVTAYDGLKYPSWHPPVVVNPITGVGTCVFGHEHGRNPSDYQFYKEIAQHYGKDLNGDGLIAEMKVDAQGRITPGDRAGLPFGLANEHMEMYYNKEGRDSIFVRHEDHVGHKIEYVNGEADMAGHSTHVLGSNTSGGVEIPYGPSGSYQPTGVRCAQLHKIHQGTWSADAIRNNLHELVVHSKCTSTNPSYTGNTLILSGMIPYGIPGEYIRFCAGGNVGDDRYTHVCADGGSSPSCTLNDPLISKLPSDRFPNTLGRNMVDRVCLNKLAARGAGTYFAPYEIWEGNLSILTTGGRELATFGRQWEVLDPIRYVDSSKPGGIGYNSQECNGLLKGLTARCSGVNYPYDSVNSPFKGLDRSMYIGRNVVGNSGGAQIWWTDPLGGNAVTGSFQSGLKQFISPVSANMLNIILPNGQFLNDRSIKRYFDDGGNTVHAPN